MDGDITMQDADSPRYPEPSAPATPTPYPAMYHGESPLVQLQNLAPTSQLNGGPAMQSNGDSSSMEGQLWTSDFYRRLSAISNLGYSSRPAVAGDGILIQDTDEQEFDDPSQPAIIGDGIRIQDMDDQRFDDLLESALANKDIDIEDTSDGSPVLHGKGDDQQDASHSRGRGRGRGRGSRGGAPNRGRRGGRSRGWKALLQGTEHADLFAKPKRPREPTGKRRGRKPAHLQPSVNASGEQWMDPGPEFRMLQGNATRAFLDGDLETALDNAKLALEKNPEVFVAHKMIHDIYQQQGKERDAIYALAVGVHLRKNADTYAELGERIMALGTKEYEWARECFSEAIKIDSENYRARAGKLELHITLEEWTSARVDARLLVRLFPAELELVNKYAGLCMQSGNFYEWESAQIAYEAAIEVYENEDMLGDDYEQQWTHVNDYSEILLKRGLHQQGMYQLKRLARRILGRKNDVFWDRVPDDREFDTSEDRRLELWEYRQTTVSKDPAQYGDGLPLELRIKLGLLRLRMFMREEAFRHFEFLQRQNADIEGLEDLFREVAEYLKNEAMFPEALTFFERLLPLQSDHNIRFWLSLAQCYLALGRNEDAEMCYVKATKADEYDLESRTQLARLYTSMGQDEKALKLVHEVMEIGSRPIPSKLPPLHPKPSNADLPAEIGTPLSAVPGSTTPAATLPALTPTSMPIKLPPGPRRRLENARGLNGRFEAWTPETPKDAGTRPAEKFETVKSRVHEHYAVVQDLWPVVRAGEDESSISKWMEHADAMAVEFKRAQTLTINDARHKEPTRPTRLPQAVVHEMEYIKKAALRKLNVPTDTAPPGQSQHSKGKIFSISAGEWHCLLSDLILLYAQRVDQERCYDFLQSCLLKSPIFRQDSELSNTSQAISLYCALLFNDGRLMTDVAHHYILRGQRQSGMSFQLLGATGRLSHGQAYFYDRKANKWLHEQVAARANAPPDPGLLTIYGHNSGGSTHANGRPALPFLLHALALQPDNIVINLSVATTYLNNAIQKNPADREHQILQGMAFFHRYYDLRVADGSAVHLQEAEFNRARMWQQLGFVHRAMGGYEKVLAMSEEVKREVFWDGEDFTMEAAFALQRVLFDAGNEDAARVIGEKWLVL